MKLDILSCILYIFSLIATTSHQPANIADWGRITERSYDLTYNRGHDQAKSPVYQGDYYYPDYGYHLWHSSGRRDHHNNENHHRGNERNPSGPRLTNRQGENSEVLSRRTFDVGHSDYGPQSLGHGLGDMDLGKIRKRMFWSIQCRKKDGYSYKKSGDNRKERFTHKIIRRDESVTEMYEEDMLAQEKVAKENDTVAEMLTKAQETGRDLTVKLNESGMPGGKRSNSSGGGKGSLPRRGSARPKNPSGISSAKRNITQNFDFVFPDSPIFRPKTTGCGENSTFCERMGDDYPKEYIKQLLQKEGDKFKAVFGRDTILMGGNISERVLKPEIDLCPSSQRIIFPTQAKKTDEKWLFIINQDGYKQGIGVETCIETGKPCSMTDSFPLSYRTSCQQKYITRRLLSLDENGGPGMNEFLVPSCCMCVVERVAPGTRSKTRS